MQPKALPGKLFATKREPARHCRGQARSSRCVHAKNLHSQFQTGDNDENPLGHSHTHFYLCLRSGPQTRTPLQQRNAQGQLWIHNLRDPADWPPTVGRGSCPIKDSLGFHEGIADASEVNATVRLGLVGPSRNQIEFASAQRQTGCPSLSRRNSTMMSRIFPSMIA